MDHDFTNTGFMYNDTWAVTSGRKNIILVGQTMHLHMSKTWKPIITFEDKLNRLSLPHRPTHMHDLKF